MRLLLTIVVLVSWAHLWPLETQRQQQKAPPFVIVQAVDAVWAPVPGAKVVLKEKLGSKSAYQAATDAEGFAKFWFAPPSADQTYQLEVSMPGFRKAVIPSLRFGVCSGDCAYPRYVQVQLEVAGVGYAP